MHAPVAKYKIRKSNKKDKLYLASLSCEFFQYFIFVTTHKIENYMINWPFLNKIFMTNKKIPTRKYN